MKGPITKASGCTYLFPRPGRCTETPECWPSAWILIDPPWIIDTVRAWERSIGLSDSLKGALESEALPALLNTVLAQTQYHDLPGLVAALEKGGLDPQVRSWLGNGTNLPITADQLKTVLGNSQVQEFARHFGLPVDQTLDALAKYLPEIVDKASPNGTLQSQ